MSKNGLSGINEQSLGFTTNEIINVIRVENNGFEPLTPCVQSRCSSQLS